jgi:hypothetical protein
MIMVEDCNYENEIQSLLLQIYLSGLNLAHAFTLQEKAVF